MAFLTRLILPPAVPSHPPPPSSAPALAPPSALPLPLPAPLDSLKPRPEKALPARPPLAQLFNADSPPVSMNTDELDTPTEDDRRKSQRRRSSRADALSRRGSLSTSLHSSSSPHRPFPDENNFPSASQGLYENLATFTFGSHSARDAIAPFADHDPDDDDERIRNDRAKMRAIDDGTRRPSLPSNIPDPNSSQAERRPSQPINIPRPPPNLNSPINTAPNSFDAWPVGSWPHSNAGSSPQDVSPSPPSSAHPDPGDAPLAGFDIEFIMAPPLDMPDSRSSQHHQQHSTHFLATLNFGSSSAGGRRPSNVSILSDQNDTFFRHINKNDVEYTDRRKQWSFRRRTIGAPKDKNGNPSQLWECAIAGKFSVSRCRSSRESLDGKPQPLRLLVRPYHPPLPQASQASRHPSHPSVLIHKHSRANAFSIFRANKLRTTHMSASHCVLLAPLKVQVHYTETRSTRALQTYDFFKDKEEGDEQGDRISNADRSSERRVSPIPMDLITSAISNSTQPVAGPSTLRVSPPTPINLNTSQSPSRGPFSPLPEEEEDDDDDDDMKGYVRKSHADAFATLDDKQLEAHRLARQSPHEPVPIPIEVNRVRQSRFGSALRRAFAGAPTAPHHTTSTTDRAFADDVNGIYNPPWLTLPPRALQERNARTLHQLNKSFEDVGLLPHRRKVVQMPKSQDGTGSTKSSPFSRKNRGQPPLHGEAFEVVPEDSPVMLLPMWASEESLDAFEKGKRGETSSTRSIPIYERRYLLIYYVPFAPGTSGSGSGGREGRNAKKRARPSTANTELQRLGSEKSKHLSEHLTAFRVVAKVLSYEDVRTSGLRLPNEGIEISHSSSPSTPGCDANFTVPPILSNFGDTMVIAICPSPESTIEFVPEGLDKLGLCYRPGDLPISSIADPAECERLSPVGRAIVEMAWVGCLSVMGLASTL